MSKIKVQKDTDQAVYCPNCNEDITELISKKIDIGNFVWVFACSNCKKLVPVTVMI